MSSVLLAICSKGEVQQESNCTMMAKHVFIYLAVYTLFLQLTRGMVKIFDLIPGYKVATVILKQRINLTQKLLTGSKFFKGFFLYFFLKKLPQIKARKDNTTTHFFFSCMIKSTGIPSSRYECVINVKLSH